MRLPAKDAHDFQQHVWGHYDRHGRDMPWRRNTSLYHVLVSELMLQQTQVTRVIPKFEAFMQRFPDVQSLASSSLADVIVMWQGLGYNRRAKYLHEAARRIVERGEPTTREALLDLPGVGINTAGAIMAYTYNQPGVFVETNVRTVYIHHFFADQSSVNDRDIATLVEQTLDRDNPREWYWAIMDYGSYLKQTDTRLHQSRQYKKQPPLRGSLREMRGRIVRHMSQYLSCDLASLRDELADERFDTALAGLVADGLVTHRAGQISLTGADKTS